MGIRLCRRRSAPPARPSLPTRLAPGRRQATRSTESQCNERTIRRRQCRRCRSGRDQLRRDMAWCRKPAHCQKDHTYQAKQQQPDNWRWCHGHCVVRRLQRWVSVDVARQFHYERRQRSGHHTNSDNLSHHAVRVFPHFGPRQRDGRMRRRRVSIVRRLVAGINKSSLLGVAAPTVPHLLAPAVRKFVARLQQH